MLPPDIIADVGTTYPFSVSWVIVSTSVSHIMMVNSSNRQQEIILHPSSCFVLGRNGTGYASLHLNPGRDLIKRFRKTTTMLFKMLGVERSSAALSSKKMRQMFVTQSRVLVERTQEYYTKLARSSAAGDRSEGEIKQRATQRTQAEKEIMELDDDDDTQSRLPKKFSELTDDHFPLFLTFDKVGSYLNTLRPIWC
jgi:hypothetical protein